MSQPAFIDTHRFITNLTASGFTMQQAKALSEEQVNAQTVLLNSNFATKQDVAELRADMAGLRTELKQDVAGLRTDMAESKAELMKWVVTMNLASAALIVTLIKVL